MITPFDQVSKLSPEFEPKPHTSGPVISGKPRRTTCEVGESGTHQRVWLQEHVQEMAPKHPKLAVFPLTFPVAQPFESKYQAQIGANPSS